MVTPPQHFYYHHYYECYSYHYLEGDPEAERSRGGQPAGCGSPAFVTLPSPHSWLTASPKEKRDFSSFHDLRMTHSRSPSRGSRAQIPVLGHQGNTLSSPSLLARPLNPAGLVEPSGCVQWGSQLQPPGLPSQAGRAGPTCSEGAASTEGVWVRVSAGNSPFQCAQRLFPGTQDFQL